MYYVRNFPEHIIKKEFLTFECTTKRLQVQQQVNSKVNFEDVNVNHFLN